MKVSAKIVLLLCIPLISLISCGDKESLKEKEAKKIKKQLENIKVDFYKTVKITVRSTAAVPNDPKFAEARDGMISIATGLFQYNVAADGGINSDSTKLGPMDILTMAQTFYSAKDVLLKTDEDSLPTILDNIFFLLNGGKTGGRKELSFFTSYDKNYEHAILGALWTATPSGPKEFSLYEFYKTDEDKIVDKEIVLVVKMAKSLMFLENEYYYHSKEKSDEYLKTVEDNKDYLLSNPMITLFEEVQGATPEQQYYQLHSIGYILRSLAEEKMDMQDEADDDMEMFVEEAEKGGGDNELIWLAGAYINVKKENKDKALVYLNKLEKSDKIGEPEKKAVADIKKYLNERDGEKALTKFKDKLALVSISFDLAKSRLMESKQIKKFKASKEGDKFFGLQKGINEKSELINSLGNATNTDSLGTKAKDLVKDFFK